MRDLDNREVDMIVDRPFDAAASGAICYRGSFAAAFVELTHALRHRTGYVVVTGKRGVGKSTFVQSVLADFDAFAVATVSAVNRHPCYAIEKLALSRGSLSPEASVTEKRAELFYMVAEARAVGKSIVIVVEDADWADAGQLHDLCTALALDPRIDEMVQVVLVGSPDLEAKLCRRAARTLAERVTARIEIRTPGEPGDDQRSHRATTEPRGRLASVLRSARRVLGNATPPVGALLLFLAAGVHGDLGTLDASIAQASDSPARSRLVEGHSDPCAGLGAAFSGICRHLDRERRAKEGRVERGGSADGEVDGTTARPADTVGTEGASEPSEPSGRAGRAGKDEQVRPASDEHVPAPSQEPEQKPTPLHRPYPVVLGSVRPDATSPKHAHAKAGKLVIDWPSRRSLPSNALAMARFEAATVRDDGPVDAATAPATVTLPEHQIALHVAAFRSLAPSLTLKSRLARDYEHVYVRKVIDARGALYRVRIGRFASVEEAEPVAARLRAAGYATHTATEE